MTCLCADGNHEKCPGEMSTNDFLNHKTAPCDCDCGHPHIAAEEDSK